MSSDETSDKGTTKPGPSKGKDAGQSGEEKVQETLGQGGQPEGEPGAATEEEKPRVVFNLDTTGFRLPRHITQIAARSETGDTFERFVKPDKDIEDIAQRETKIKYKYQQMYYDGDRVDSFGINEVLQEFIRFLEGQDRGRGVLLICHSESYHCYVLTEAVIACNLIERFRTVLYRWLDVKPFFMEVEEAAYDDYSLGALYGRHTRGEFTAHESRGRVAALSEIFEQNTDINVDSDDESYTSTLDYTLNRITWREAVDVKDSRGRVVERRAATDDTARKASKRGIVWDDVQRAYRAEREQGVTELLRGRRDVRGRIVAYLNRTENV